MDIRKVKKLIELLDESGIAEIEITEGEESVRISRYAAGAPVAAAPVAAAPAAPPVAAPVVAPPADGWHVLRRIVARRRALYPGRRPRERRRHALHYRSDENDESDRSRRFRHRQIDSHTEWRTCRIWTGTFRH